MDEKKLKSLISDLTENAPFNEYISDTHDLLNTLMSIDLEDNDKDIVTNIQKRFQLFFPLHEIERPLPENMPKYYIIDCPFNKIQKIAIWNLLSQSIVDIQNGKFQVLRNSLEKICTHPYLISGNELYFRAPLEEASPKFDIITKLIQQSVQNNKKIAILSQHLKFLDMVHDYCEINSISSMYDRINASVSLLYTKERATIEDLTNANTLVFVDTPLVYLSGKKDVYQLMCNDVGENDWDLIDDETLCKYITIKAFQTYEMKSTDYLLENPLEIPNAVSQIIVNAAEKPNFWNDFLDLKPYESEEYKNPTENAESGQNYEQIDREFTVREQNQFLRGLFSFGLNKWDTMREQIAINLSTDEMKVEAYKVLRLTLDNNDNPEEHYIISDIINKNSVDSKYLKVNPDLINELSDNSNRYLEKIELLEFLHACIPEGSTIDTVKNLYCFTDFDPATISQFPGPSKKHEQWWNDTYDKALLLGYSKFGINYLDDFALDDDEYVRNIFKLTTNVEGLQAQGRKLLHRLRYNYSPEHYVIAFFISDEIKSNWTRPELNSIVNHLSNFGVPQDNEGKEDYASLISKLSLNNHKEEEIGALVDDIIKNCTKKSVHEEFEHAAKLFTDKIEAMSNLHFIVDNRDKDSLVELIRKAPKWKNMPKLFTAEIEYIFLTELVQRGFNEVKAIMAMSQIMTAFGKMPSSTAFKFDNISNRLKNLAKSIRESLDPNQKKKPEPAIHHESSRSKSRSKPKTRPAPQPPAVSQTSAGSEDGTTQSRKKNNNNDEEEYSLPKKKAPKQSRAFRQAHVVVDLQTISQQQTGPLPIPQIKPDEDNEEKQQEEPEQQPVEEEKQEEVQHVQETDQLIAEQNKEQTEATTNTQTDDDPSVSPSSSESEDSEDFHERRAKPKSRWSRQPASDQHNSKSNPILSNLQRQKMNSKLRYDTLTLPLEITQTTKLYSLGEIVYDRPGFHTERYIYPSGYKISRIAKSTTVPDELVTWFCEIIDTGEDSPLFRVTSEDGKAVYEGVTPTAPWSQILRQIAKVNGYAGRALSVSGPEQYLLSNKIINNLILQMPGVDKCQNLNNPKPKATTKPSHASASSKQAYYSQHADDDDDDDDGEYHEYSRSRQKQQPQPKPAPRSKPRRRIIPPSDEDDDDDSDMNLNDHQSDNSDDEEEYVEPKPQKHRQPKQEVKKEPVQNPPPKNTNKANDNDNEEEEDSPTPSDSSDEDFRG